jgi:transcriptional regulator with XRE-family HTH domain
MYEVFERLMKERGENFSDVARAIGGRPSTFSDWRAGRSTPSAAKFLALSKHFGVPMEYLLTGEWPAADDASPHLSPDEEELLRGYRVASGPVRKIMLDAARDALKGEGGARLSDFEDKRA